MAAEKAVGNTVKEETVQTLEKEDSDRADQQLKAGTDKKEEASAATDLADHSVRTRKEDLTEKEGHSEKTQKEEASTVTDLADHSVRIRKEGHSEKILKEEVSTATDLADHSVRIRKEDLTEKEGHSETESRADSETPEGRASTRRISITSVMRRREESIK